MLAVPEGVLDPERAPGLLEKVPVIALHLSAGVIGPEKSPGLLKEQVQVTDLPAAVLSPDLAPRWHESWCLGNWLFCFGAG